MQNEPLLLRKCVGFLLVTSWRDQITACSLAMGSTTGPAMCTATRPRVQFTELSKSIHAGQTRARATLAPKPNVPHAWSTLLWDLQNTVWAYTVLAMCMGKLQLRAVSNSEKWP